MRIPGVGLVRRVPVPSVVPLLVRSLAAPVVETVSSYAVVARDLLDHLADEAIAEVVRRVDLDATVQRLDIEAVLDRIDLTSTVVKRVDLDVLVGEVFARVDAEQVMELVGKVDVDAIAGRLDIDALLDQLDLTDIVLKRVDLVKVVDAVLAQIDLITIANEIIEGVDLPEIIRDSTGSMASETVKGVRMQGIGADQAVDRAIDRLLLRRTRTSSPSAPDGA
jgi:hypothetical protein